jgi:hypothetical protein
MVKFGVLKKPLNQNSAHFGAVFNVISTVQFKRDSYSNITLSGFYKKH